MAMHSDRHDHWMDGNLDERLLLLAIIAMVALSPFLVLFYW